MSCPSKCAPKWRAASSPSSTPIRERERSTSCPSAAGSAERRSRISGSTGLLVAIASSRDRAQDVLDVERELVPAAAGPGRSCCRSWRRNSSSAAPDWPASTLAGSPGAAWMRKKLTTAMANRTTHPFSEPCGQKPDEIRVAARRHAFSFSARRGSRHRRRPPLSRDP